MNTISGTNPFILNTANSSSLTIPADQFVITSANIQTPSFSFMGQDGKPCLILHSDGTVETTIDTAEEGARVLVNHVRQYWRESAPNPPRRTAEQQLKRLKDYLDDYEYRGDGGDYTPNDRERELIEDALHGWLVEQETLP